jgi:hypothetical protein
MAGAPLHEGKIVEWWRLQRHRVRLDGVPHGEMQEPGGDGPMPGGRRHIVEPGPGEEQAADDQNEGKAGERCDLSLHRLRRTSTRSPETNEPARVRFCETRDGVPG